MNYTAVLLSIFSTGAAVMAGPIQYDEFGVLANATFGGSGIPNDAVAITTITDGDNTITIGLTAHARYDNPPVLNNGAGVFYAQPGVNTPSGTSIPGALWNFAWYVQIEGAKSIADYEVTLAYDFNPGKSTPVEQLGLIYIDTAVAAVAPTLTLAQGSENLAFGYLSGVPAIDYVMPPYTAEGGLSFDPDATGEYTFMLAVGDKSENSLGWAAIRVQVVPDPAATLALLGVALAGLAWMRRRVA